MLLVNTILMLMTFIAFLLALGVHYSAQSLVAIVLGDTSPSRERRLTLNPVRHLSPFGTCVAVISSFTFGLPAGIGWGTIIRPDARRLRIGANAGVIVIALSGILANLIIGVGLSFVFRSIPLHGADLLNCPLAAGGPLQSCLESWQPGWLLRIEQFGFIFASVNIAFGIFNLIPLFPLDGYHILFTLLPNGPAISYRNSEQWQELGLAALIFFLPFLLSLAGISFSLLGLLQGESYAIVETITNGQFGFLLNL